MQTESIHRNWTPNSRAIWRASLYTAGQIAVSISTKCFLIFLYRSWVIMVALVYRWLIVVYSGQDFIPPVLDRCTLGSDLVPTWIRRKALTSCMCSDKWAVLHRMCARVGKFVVNFGFGESYGDQCYLMATTAQTLYEVHPAVWCFR